jgi:hypothetical protein
VTGRLRRPARPGLIASGTRRIWTWTSPRSGRATRIAVPVLTGVAAIVAAVRIAEVLLIPGYLGAAVGTDIRWYLAAAQRWLAGGGWYEPAQLAGPYDLAVTGVLYPPSALALFVPFTVLPLVLWWAIPLAVTGAMVVRNRPTALGWAVIAVCLAFPMSLTHLLNGNPVMWAAMLVALGTRWGWPAAVIAPLKPSLFLFAMVGVHRRSWWFGVAAIAAVNVALLPLWLDYLTALRNAAGPQASVLYSLKDVPLLSIPLVAWATRSGRGASGASHA